MTKHIDTKGYNGGYLNQGFGMSYSENYILLVSDTFTLDIGNFDPADGTWRNHLDHADLQWKSIHCELQFAPNSDAVFFLSVVERNIGQGILCRG